MRLPRLLNRRLWAAMLVVVAAIGIGLHVGRLPAARAQALPTATGVEATLFTNTARWTTTPSVFVTGELRDASGNVRGNATALSDAQGVVVLTFAAGGGRGPGQPGTGSGTVQATNEIRLAPATASSAAPRRAASWTWPRPSAARPAPAPSPWTARAPSPTAFPRPRLSRRRTPAA